MSRPSFESRDSRTPRGASSSGSSSAHRFSVVGRGVVEALGTDATAGEAAGLDGGVTTGVRTAGDFTSGGFAVTGGGSGSEAGEVGRAGAGGLVWGAEGGAAAAGVAAFGGAVAAAFCVGGTDGLATAGDCLASGVRGRDAAGDPAEGRAACVSSCLVAASGTRIGSVQAGQFTVAPILRLEMLSSCLQCGHRNWIGMRNPYSGTVTTNSATYFFPSTPVKYLSSSSDASEAASATSSTNPEGTSVSDRMITFRFSRMTPSRT